MVKYTPWNHSYLQAVLMVVYSSKIQTQLSIFHVKIRQQPSQGSQVTC